MYNIDSGYRFGQTDLAEMLLRRLRSHFGLISATSIFKKMLQNPYFLLNSYILHVILEGTFPFRPRQKSTPNVPKLFTMCSNIHLSSKKSQWDFRLSRFFRPKSHFEVWQLSDSMKISRFESHFWVTQKLLKSKYPDLRRFSQPYKPFWCTILIQEIVSAKLIWPKCF